MKGSYVACRARETELGDRVVDSGLDSIEDKLQRAILLD